MVRESEICLILSLSIFSFIAFSEGFDSFWMVHQWPPSVCSDRSLTTHCSGPVEHMFTINGFWPYLKSQGQQINCDPSNHFNMANVISIQGDLKTYWPDVISGDYRRLWTKEWSKHGTCSDPPFDQSAYFTHALNNRLKHDYDLEGILRDARITPTGSSIYTSEEIKKILTNALRKKPILRCNTNVDGVRQLVDIILCFAHDGFTLVDCPPNNDKCPSGFLWLPHNATNIAMVTDK